MSDWVDGRVPPEEQKPTVGQLVEIGVLRSVDPDAYNRRFFAPRVLDVLTGGEDTTAMG